MSKKLGIAALALMAAGLAAPMGEASWMDSTPAFGFAVAACIAAACCLGALTMAMRHAISLIGLSCGVIATLLLLGTSATFGVQAIGLWLFVAGWLLFLWQELDTLARVPAHGVTALAAPALFGLALLFLWQVLVVAFAIPQVLLPTPAKVATVLANRGDILWPDFRQTFLKAVLAGYVMGNGAGFLAAMVADRIPWLKRGVLPLCNLAAAVPIVGIAPIMVMWFGFDWQSKAAVVAVITFFPMLVNALAGLDSVDAMQRDLMRSYAATPGQAFARLRLPSALPFIFNALKVNSTLALIAAIVAEFFGSPILGLGFRISTEVARLNVDVVWAVIAIAALAGSIFYGVVAAIERGLTFWHPSYRS